MAPCPFPGGIEMKRQSVDPTRQLLAEQAVEFLVASNRQLPLKGIRDHGKLEVAFRARATVPMTFVIHFQITGLKCRRYLFFYNLLQ